MSAANMEAFHCDLEGLKKRAREFLDALPSLETQEEVEGGCHGFFLSYFHCEYKHPADEPQAVSLVKFVSRRVVEREARGFDH